MRSGECPAISDGHAFHAHPSKVRNQRGAAAGSLCTYFLNYGTAEIRAKAEENALELDEWLGPLMLRDGDRVGALLAALRTRHSDPDYAQRRGSDLAMELHARQRPRRAHGHLRPRLRLAPYDALLAELRQKLGD